MIGIDTNVLVRYLTADDPEQLARVDRLFAETAERGQQLIVDTIVLCEVVWVLRTAYGYARGEITEAVEQVVSTHLFSIDDRETVRRALAAYREGGGDFADYWIGERNHRSGCQTTMTFDRRLRGAARFRLL